MDTLKVIGGIVLAIFVIGGSLDFLRLFGIYISDWTIIFFIVAVVAVWKWKAIARTVDYLFVKYPTAPAATPGAGTGGSAPTFHLENRAQAERAMKDKFDAEAEIADATIRRERARAALEDAEQEVEAARRRSQERP